VPRIRVLAGGHLVIAVTILLGVLASHTGQNVLHALVATLLAFQAVSGFRSFLGLRRLEIEVAPPSRLDAGGIGSCTVLVRNAKRRVSACSLEVDVACEPAAVLSVAPGWVGRLAPGEEVRLALPVRAAHRGAARFVEVRVASAWPCDLFRRVLRFPLGAEALVRPARRVARPPDRGAADAAEGRVRFATRAGEELRGVRPWREGDAPRAIHWKSSARAGSLVVREDESRRRAPWTIVVAPDPSSAVATEADLEVAAALVRAAVARGRAASLRLAGRPAEIGLADRAGLAAALDALARHEPTQAPPPGGPVRGRAFLVGRLARPPAGATLVERAPFPWILGASAPEGGA
jgi:uncharacterized protein (DUF58 family)